MNNTILRADNISKSYKSGEPVINDISLRIEEGSFTAIMGPSGVGKSTLLGILDRTEADCGGHIFYRDREITGLPEKEVSALFGKEFSFVFQEPRLVSFLSVRENVEVAGLACGKISGDEVKEKTTALLENFELSGVDTHFPSEISGGEAQRCAIARAVISNPGILFADEPTGALNRKNTDAVLDIFSDIAEAGQTIVMVTHDIRCAARADRVLFLDDGTIADELEQGRYERNLHTERQERLEKWLSALQW